MGAAGRLKVFLGAAPGVGKSYAMFREGHRLADEGRDVVVALAETHGRAGTERLLGGLEIIERQEVEHRGVVLREMDTDAVLARRPEVSLVDELAHSNPAGSSNPKRYQDIQRLLEAGIDVLTTVNIQHVDSLNDVIEKITGVSQRETLPDAVLRAADEIEVVDLAPQALRGRLAEGSVYPAERIDAAMSNYFRLGNLTALRELTLLWMADEVDHALLDYRRLHGIDSSWQARENVLVSLSGGPEGQALIRRGARIAARSAGGTLIVVHVSTQDGLRRSDPHELGAQRLLAESLGGSYHQVVGEDIPAALLEFAREVNASQVVIGQSRRSRLQALFTGEGMGAGIIRAAGDIDVHIVSHAAAHGHRVLPRPGPPLSLRRRLLGFAVALVGGPLLTMLLTAFFSTDTLSAAALGYQLLVTLAAVAGGKWPALCTAIGSGVSLNFFFIEPLYTVTVYEPVHVLTLGLYVLTGLITSYVVDLAARQTRNARRSASESQMLQAVAGNVLRGQDAQHALLERTREAFGLKAARLVDAGREIDLVGAADGAPDQVLSVDDAAVLELYGSVPNTGRRLLQVVTAQLAALRELRALEDTASQLEPLAETDRVRSALLSAVSHDLRRPLAAAMAAVGSLKATDIQFSEEDRGELLSTADQSLHALAELVTDLLDVSRLQAGALAVHPQRIYVDEVILASLDELGAGPAQIQLDLDADLPAVDADPVLLQRALVNVLANALRFNAGKPVLVGSSALGDTVQIRVADSGPGVDEGRKKTMFLPFQRLGDTDNQTGLGLGLAVAKGFIEGMGGALYAEDTPGGGLTMVVDLLVSATQKDG